MRFGAVIFLIFAAFAAISSAQTERAEVLRFREHRDKLFRDPVFSPLPRNEIGSFIGLKYYDFTAEMIVKAVFEPVDGEQVFLMPASRGSDQRFLKHGILRFRLGGAERTLTVFRSESSAKRNGSLFLPFRDETSGSETYGAGRYIDIAAPSGSEITIDFNYAYSPSCAFSDEFACPFPPRENYLGTPVRAGEKIYRERPQGK